MGAAAAGGVLTRPGLDMKRRPGFLAGPDRRWVNRLEYGMDRTTKPAAVLLAEVKAAAVSSKRSAFAAGLRAIADAIDADPALPLPYDGTSQSITWYVHTAEEFAAVRRLLAEGTPVKFDSSAGPHYRLFADGAVHGVRIDVRANPDEVCEVSSTRTVEVRDYVLDGELIGPVA